MELLFSNVTCVTMDCENKNRVSEHMYIGVEDGKITYLSDVPPTEKAEKIIEDENLVVIPGLINAHSHVAMTRLRGCANDLPLEEWLFGNIIKREDMFTPEDVYYGSLLGMLESVSTGTVALCDMYSRLEAIAQAAEKVGIKINLTNAITSFDENEDLSKNRATTENLTIMEKYKDSRLVNGVNGIHGVYTSHPRAWRHMKDMAVENGKPMYVHASETKTEHENSIAKFGATPLKALDNNGILEVPTAAAHCVWVSDDDMELMKEKNVTAVHCPSSNLILASGVAKVKKMLDMGINVALGTDGAASNNSLDMFSEMKLASLLQKGTTLDSTAVSAYDALKMATVNGAKALGIKSGMIKVGYNADLAVLDFTRIGLSPCYDVINNIVYSAHGSDVVMTVIDGKIVYDHGKFSADIDIDKLRKTIQDSIN